MASKPGRNGVAADGAGVSSPALDVSAPLLNAGVPRATAIILVALLCGCGGSGSSTPTAPPADNGTCAMAESALPNEGWVHVAEGTPLTYLHNPPASGPHYPVWARYQAYTTALVRPYWVHNLEHGAIVLVYRPDAPSALVSALTDTFRALPNDPECGHPRSLLTPDPQLARPVSAIAANFVLEGDCVSPDQIRTFALAHRNHSPEDICDSGTRP